MDGLKSPVDVKPFSSSFKKMQILPSIVPNHSQEKMIQLDKKGPFPMNAEILKITQNTQTNP